MATLALILYNRKFKTNFRNGYRYRYGSQAPDRSGNALEFWRLPQRLPFRWMTFWLRRRLTASNSSLEKSRGWWVSENLAGKPSSGSALRRWTTSQRAIKLVIEYCLEVLEEVEEKIRGKASLARLEAALNLQYAEQNENKVYQYRWALRHPVVNEAITRAMGNRFPSS